MIPVLFLFWFAFVSGIVLVLDKRKSTKSNPKKKKKKQIWLVFLCLNCSRSPHQGVGGQTSTLLSQTNILGAGDTLVEGLYVNLTFLYSIAQVRFL